MLSVITSTKATVVISMTNSTALFPLTIANAVLTASFNSFKIPFTTITNSFEFSSKFAKLAEVVGPLEVDELVIIDFRIIFGS